MRRFCLGAFAYLYRESSEEAPIPFAFEEHAAPGRPALYEYRPLARGYVEARADHVIVECPHPYDLGPLRQLLAAAATMGG